MRIRAGLWLAVAWLGGSVAAARAAPAVDAGLVGCWRLWPGEELTIRRQRGRADRLEARSRLDMGVLAERFRTRGRGGVVRTRWAPVLPVPAAGGGWFEIACGPKTQHGQFCRVRADGDGDGDGDGELEVALWTRGFGGHDGAKAALASTTRARRCGAGAP